MAKQYLVDLSWRVFESVHVEAESAKEACQKAITRFGLSEESQEAQADANEEAILEEGDL